MDLYPVKAQFLSGEEVELRLDTDGHICEYAEVSIYHLNDLVYRQKLLILPVIYSFLLENMIPLLLVTVLR